MSDLLAMAESSEHLAGVLPRVFDASDYVSRYLDRHRDWFATAIDEGWFERAPSHADHCADLDALIGEGADDQGVMTGLRRFRHRNTVRIAVREIAGWATLDETLEQLSLVAQVCCDRALNHARAHWTARHGCPRTDDGTEVVPVVLAMGKLGGGELNFSSDIDLIFCFTDAGDTDGERSEHTDRYFSRVVQSMTRLLTETTVDGWAYRVDWRLRPFGDAGPPAISFDAMEQYYLVHGREWERYALVKARPVAGDLAAGDELLDRLRPFVYRRYLDFNAIGSLRDLKRRIAAEVARRDMGDHVKLGPGGIRELEFIVQAIQLIRGGQDPSLQSPRLRPALAKLAQLGHLDADRVQELDAAYVLLRRVENALQMAGDRQVHVIPEAQPARDAIAAALGAADWNVLSDDLTARRHLVREVFDELFDEPERSDDVTSLDDALVAAWDDPASSDALRSALQGLGCKDDEVMVEQITALAGERKVRGLSEGPLRQLRTVVALLTDELAEHERLTRVAPRVFSLLTAIVGRQTYLALLSESHTARTQLIRLCAASSWIADLLRRTPALLDALLDTRTLYSPPDAQTIRDDLASTMEQIAEDDVESRMDALRRYKQETTLRIAAADALEALPLVKVSDRLTWLAEAMIACALDAVWSIMVDEYGAPTNTDGQPTDFAVVGYGKLGGLEMGYASDLDLVFLHNADRPMAETEGGRRAIPIGMFFARLGQRVVHWLSTQTPAGRAYEVDLRLRPSGAAGMLVTSLDGFARYQRENAWTWEHQALVRARPVAGSEALGEQFERARRDILCAPRDGEALRAEVVSMRRKMRGELLKRDDGRFDLKQGEGGLTDLEFLTQYLVLRHAPDAPSLVQWSDNWRQTDALVEAGVLTQQEGDELIDAYRAYRRWLHQRDLDQRDRLCADDKFRAHRKRVAELWQVHLGE